MRRILLLALKEYKGFVMLVQQNEVSGKCEVEALKHILANQHPIPDVLHSNPPIATNKSPRNDCNGLWSKVLATFQQLIPKSVRSPATAPSANTAVAAHSPGKPAMLRAALSNGGDPLGRLHSAETSPPSNGVLEHVVRGLG